jgi:hypothetical protein
MAVAAVGASTRVAAVTAIVRPLVGFPQRRQNLAPGGLPAPQEGQAASTGVPHSTQKAESGGFSARQAEQRMKTVFDPTERKDGPPLRPKLPQRFLGEVQRAGSMQTLQYDGRILCASAQVVNRCRAPGARR